MLLPFPRVFLELGGGFCGAVLSCVRSRKSSSPGVCCSSLMQMAVGGVVTYCPLACLAGDEPGGHLSGCGDIVTFGCSIILGRGRAVSGLCMVGDGRGLRCWLRLAC